MIRHTAFFFCGITLGSVLLSSSGCSVAMTGADGTALLWRNSRTTDSPGTAKSAEFPPRLTPRPAACALSTDSAHNAARRGGESRIQVSAPSRAGRCALELEVL
jgi:hypothetical protein